MAKRYTDSEKYKNPFFRGLTGPYKIFWDYLYHACDNAGIWCVDFEIAQIYIGKDMPITREAALAAFNNGKLRVVEFDGGNRWFLPGFIDWQHNGALSPDNRAHVGAIKSLEKYGFWRDGQIVLPEIQLFENEKQDPSKGQASPLQAPSEGAICNGNGIGTVNGHGTKTARAKKTNAADLIPDSWNREEFNELWADFVKVRQAKKKVLTDTGTKQLIGKLKNLAGDEWWKAKGMMTQSITHSWDGFYELKPDDVKLYEPVVERDYWGHIIEKQEA